MTQKVQLSPNQTVRSYPTAGAISDVVKRGWVVTSGVDEYASYMGLSGAPLNAFAESHSASSFDVTIDTGEGFTRGKWIGKDTTTTVTLSGNTNDQTVYAGWPADSGNNVIIGTDGDFPADHGKMPLYEFSTDTSGVTDVLDHRVFSKRGEIEPTDTIPTASLNAGDSVDIRIPLRPGATIRLLGWGARTTNNTTPTGVSVAILDEDETVITSEETSWRVDPTGITALKNLESGIEWYYLRLRNDSGIDFTDPDGISAAFAYEIFRA